MVRMSLTALFGALLAAAAPLAALAQSPADQASPSEPDFATAVVYGIAPNDLLNVRATMSPMGLVIGRLTNGAVLKRFECQTVQKYLWCRIAAQNDPKITGWTPARYLMGDDGKPMQTAAVSAPTMGPSDADSAPLPPAGKIPAASAEALTPINDLPVAAALRLDGHSADTIASAEDAFSTGLVGAGAPASLHVLTPLVDGPADPADDGGPAFAKAPRPTPRPDMAPQKAAQAWGDLALDTATVAAESAAPASTLTETVAIPPAAMTPAAISAPAAVPPSAAAPSSVAPTTDNKAPQANASSIPCARYLGQPMTRCDVRVVRTDTTSADLTVAWPDGETRVIEFRDGKPQGSNGRGDFRYTREATLNLVRIGPSERFEITDAVAFGD